MAKIASKVLWWSAVADASQYFVRITPAGAKFDYAKEPDVKVPQVTGKAEYETDLKGLSLAEGKYDIHITPVDAAGNEGDPFDLNGAVLDFTPPSPVISGGFR